MHRSLAARPASALGIIVLCLVANGCGRSTSATATTRSAGQTGTFFEVSVSRPVGGTISSGADGKINCGTLGGGANACSPARYAWAETATFTATPDAGFVFAGWAADCSGASPSCTLDTETYGADKWVAAVFEPAARYAGIYFLVTVTRPTGGTVTSEDGRIRCGTAPDANACGPTLYGWDDTATLIAAADGDGTFTGWTGDCSGVGACALNTQGEGADKMVGATFIGGAGTVDPPGTGTSYTIGGTVSGLVTDGLVLSTAGEPDLIIAADETSFTFANPLPAGTSYSVTIAQQPANTTRTCTVANGTGTIAGANVTNVAISCAVAGTPTETVNAQVFRLTSPGLVLSDNGTDLLTVAPGDAFSPPVRVAFSQLVPPGGAYVRVVAQPVNQTCSVPMPKMSSGGTGFIYVDVVCRCNAGFVQSSTSCIPDSGVPGSFVATGSMAIGRARPSAMVLASGNVLVVGGQTGSPTVVTEMYDAASGTFTRTGDLKVARNLPAAALLPDGKVLVVGGWTQVAGSSTVLASAEIYDPVTRTFAATGNMTVGRGDPFLTPLQNGKVLVAGGIDDSGTTLSSAEIYDPVTGVFTPTGAMLGGHDRGHAFPLANGHAVILGGEQQTCPNGTAYACNVTYSSTADQFDPAADGGAGGFSAAGSVSSRYSAMTVLPNGKVLVVGGNGPLWWVSTAGVYDPSTGAYVETGSMPLVRGDAAAALLGNGKVLVAGGWDNYSMADSALYDPTTGTFSPTKSLVYPRYSASAVVLQDGRVLVLGGWGADGATAELYSP